MGGGKGKEKWRPDGTGAPEGQLEEGRDSHAQRGPFTTRGTTGTGRDPQGIGGPEGNAACISPHPVGLGEPADPRPDAPHDKAPSGRTEPRPSTSPPTQGLFLSHVREVFNYNLCNIFSDPFLFSSSGTSIIRMLVHLVLSQMSLRLSDRKSTRLNSSH